jgi:mannose-6-phosphate isomerase-like protein (cupin superfamily)
VFKPLLPVALVAVGYFAGSMMGTRPAQAQSQPARAQAPGPGGQGTPGRPPAATNLFVLTATPETRAVNGKAVLWTKEQIQGGSLRSHIQWSPQYRVTMTTRPALAAGASEPTSGELHTDNTQIYVVTKGSGTVLVEGTVDQKEDYLVAQGEHRGGPIVGGRKVHVKEGDVISIPPFTWHTAYGDPGVALDYMMFHVHTPQTIP